MGEVTPGMEATLVLEITDVTRVMSVVAAAAVRATATTKKFVAPCLLSLQS